MAKVVARMAFPKMWTTRDIEAMPAGAVAGVSVSSGTTAWAYGSWVVIVASGAITEDFEILALLIGHGWTQALDTLHQLVAQIGVGEAGAETPVITLPLLYYIDSAAGHARSTIISAIILTPRRVQANSRISIRVADSIAAAVAYAGVKLIIKRKG